MSVRERSSKRGEEGREGVRGKGRECVKEEEEKGNGKKGRNDRGERKIDLERERDNIENRGRR